MLTGVALGALSIPRLKSAVNTQRVTRSVSLHTPALHSKPDPQGLSALHVTGRAQRWAPPTRPASHLSPSQHQELSAPHRVSSGVPSDASLASRTSPANE